MTVIDLTNLSFSNNSLSFWLRRLSKLAIRSFSVVKATTWSAEFGSIVMTAGATDPKPLPLLVDTVREIFSGKSRPAALAADTTLVPLELLLLAVSPRAGFLADAEELSR